MKVKTSRLVIITTSVKDLTYSYSLQQNPNLQISHKSTIKCNLHFSAMWASSKNSQPEVELKIAKRRKFKSRFSTSFFCSLNHFIEENNKRKFTEQISTLTFCNSFCSQPNQTNQLLSLKLVLNI